MWGAFAWLRANEVDPDMRYVHRAAYYFEWIHKNELEWSRTGNESCTCVLYFFLYFFFCNSWIVLLFWISLERFFMLARVLDVACVCMA